MILSLLLLSNLAQAVDCPSLDAELAGVDRSSHCLTMPLRAAWRRAVELHDEACLAGALAARGLPSAPLPLEPAPPVLPFSPDKALRDSYDLPNSMQSDNFVVWWGNGAVVDRDGVEDMLDAFELGWEHMVGAMELPAPERSDAYKFNVYVGDSGSGAPSVYGNSGYFWYDSDGYPMIVMALGTLEDLEWCQTTAVHELFHAVQAATGAYAYDVGSWLWEASSTWVEGDIYPESPYYASFLFGFAFLPHLPVDFYDYPDSGAIEEYHQYGAFIFPRYLSEVAFDWTIVRDAWTHGSAGSDPLEVFDALLEPLGSDIDTTWADFVAHNATWDYQDGSTYRWYLDFYGDYYTDYSLLASYANAGTDQWQTPTQRLPQRYGAHFIELRYPNDGTLHVELELDDAGSDGSAAGWRVTLVRRGQELGYLPLEVQDGHVGERIEDIGDDTTVYLVVGATSEQRRSGETFGYSYRLWVEPEPDTQSPEDTGEGGGEKPGVCGCSAGGAAPVGWAALVLLGAAAGVRRRRR